MNLVAAIALANVAHAGQLDKAGLPYILHPLRVMQAAVAKFGAGDEAIAAVLHDVVEDTNWCDLAYLRNNAGANANVIRLLEVLTKTKGELYPDFIRRVKAAGPIAIALKKMDIADNMNRLSHLSEDTQQYLRDKYTNALNILDEDPA